MSHTHDQDKIFSLDNKIVCQDCVAEEDLGKNECYHDCHKLGKDSCKRCSKFHRS